MTTRAGAQRRRFGRDGMADEHRTTSGLYAISLS
jgi:hypothetical protein